MDCKGWDLAGGLRLMTVLIKDMCMTYIQDGIKVVSLGSLDLQVNFKFPGNDTIYTTLTYPRSLVNFNIGNRYCINQSTLKLESLQCRRKVIICSTGN